MSRSAQNRILLCTSLIIIILVCEVTLRLFIKPSDTCYGVLFNCDLPPFKIEIDDQDQDYANYNEEVDVLGKDGKKITKGDLAGILVDHPVLGYAPKENAVSLNGWWQSNNVGARSRDDITRSVPPGMRRILIFGESFTNCRELPQEETWVYHLNNDSKNIQFVNFGVDGYNMAQCLVRYELLRDRVDYDIAMFVFVHEDDLWRDLNILRQLRGWKNHPPVPRYIIQGDTLQLIKSPYQTYHDFREKNQHALSGALTRHLRSYDRLYYRTKYESPFLTGRSILYKLVARGMYTFQEKQRFDYIMKTNSEAMRIVRKIFEDMNNKATEDGKKFVLVFLPDKKDMMRYTTNDKYRKRYHDMVSAVEGKGITCIDLMSDFIKLNPGDIDASSDGWHYGPRMNKIISEKIRHHLKALNI